MSDTTLIGIAALLNLMLTFLGLFVAVRPVEHEKSKKRILFFCFLGCVVALGLSVVIAWRGERSQTTLQSTADHILGTVTSVQTVVNAIPTGSSAPAATPPPKPHYALKPNLPSGFLQLAKVQYVSGDEFFTIGKPLQVNVYYINKGPVPVQNALVSGALSLLIRDNRPQKSLDAEVLKNMTAQLRALDDKGATLGSDSLLWATPSFPVPLTQPMVDAIMQGQAVMYLVGYARWTDSYGKANDVMDCMWLTPPYSQRPELDKLVWRECMR